MMSMGPADLRVMTPADLDFAAGCTASEGWPTETREVLEGFLQHEPAGCLIAAFGSKRLGFIIATPMGVSGFIGELIVGRDARGGGIGPLLLEGAIRFLKARGVRSIYLDGVEGAVPYYRSRGFRPVCDSRRFQGRLSGSIPGSIRLLRRDDLAATAALDLKAFGADRRFFLERRFRLAPRLCWAAESGGRLSGFIMGMPGRQTIAVGPWVDSNPYGPSLDLLMGPASESGGFPLRVGVLEPRVGIVEGLRSIPGFRELPPSRRMAMGERSDLGMSPACLAIGSPAKG